MNVLASLFLFAVAPPAIQSVPCKDCPPPLPESQVVPLHIEAATQIYNPYFRCYWDELSASPSFGSTVPETAQLAMGNARDKCGGLRKRADSAMDEMLASKKIYGDSRNIEIVRENFRQRGAMVFMFMTASANGKRDEYVAMTKAALGIDQK